MSPSPRNRIDDRARRVKRGWRLGSGTTISMLLRSGSRAKPTPAKSQWQLPVRIGPLELTQQSVAALDGGIKRCLRGFFAGKGPLQFVVDHITNQHERPEPDASRIFSGRLQCGLLDRDSRAGIAR